MKETKSSKVLADYAQEQGFRVTRGVNEIPTAFFAEYGSGLPIIGVLGDLMRCLDFLKSTNYQRGF
jgi:aminobenzoyl-glutamate utilization protein B